MSKLLDKEYFHLGANKIYKELWRNVTTDQIHSQYIKPYGGLWASNINPHVISDWFGYKLDHNRIESDYDVYYEPSSIIKFRKDSKFLSIENKNDYKNLKDSGFVKVLETPLILNKFYYKKEITELVDYEKVSNFYDLMYLNPDANNMFSDYSILTMFALNPECIEYFKTTKVDFENYKILEIGKKEVIKDVDDVYKKIVEYISENFNNFFDKDYKDFISKLYKEKERLETLKDDYLEKLENLLPNELNKYRVRKAIINNIYREKYLEGQKRLLKK